MNAAAQSHSFRSLPKPCLSTTGVSIPPSKATYAPTVRFYEAAGYREISKIKDFYRIEDDKLVFSKALKP